MRGGREGSEGWEGGWVGGKVVRSGRVVRGGREGSEGWEER